MRKGKPSGRRRKICHKRLFSLSVIGLAALLVFTTVAAGSLHVDAYQTQTTYCGKEEHQHDDSCYEKVLNCLLEEGKGHVHQESCYKVLTCTEDHEHTEECWTTYDTPQCGIVETGPHTHDDSCYKLSDTLICGKEEHEHTLQCDSNPEADTEDEYDWYEWYLDLNLDEENTVHENLLEIARSQIDYAESADNYLVDEDGITKNGYTRYGAWAEDPYAAHWNPYFALFCLYYAQVDEEEFCQQRDLEQWMEDLKEKDLITVETDEIQPGDIVFYTETEEGNEMFRCGILSGLIYSAGENKLETVKVIAGDGNGKVDEESHDLEAGSIIGYGLVPEPETMDSSREILTAKEETGDPVVKRLIHALDESDLADLENLTVAIMGSNSVNAMSDTVGSFSSDPNSRLNKTQLGSSAVLTAAEVVWQFEKSGDGYCIYTVKEGGRQYLKMSTVSGNSNVANLNLTGSAANASVFSIDFESDCFYLTTVLNSSTYYLDGYNGDSEVSSDKGFAGWYKKGSGSGLKLYTVTEYTASGQFKTDTVSPSSTRINLFDYWCYDENSQRFDSDITGNMDNGINRDESGNVRSLLFSKSPDGRSDWWNKWNPGGGHGDGTVPKTGIVQNRLEQGYPVLSSSVDEAKTSLAYLFDPNVNVKGKISYPDVKNLLSVDEEGYFYYDCSRNYAYYDEGTGSFTLYNYPEGYQILDKNRIDGQFFPFNTEEQAATIGNSSGAYNHYFGLTITSRFIQEHNGYTDSSAKQRTTFHFSGDDDVWIFIDDVLVADLGGIHNACSVDIDFSDGSVYINGSSTATTTLKQAFTEAGKTTEGWNENTFANGTTHTLKFYYMERGNNASNMSIRYNLREIPDTAIYKVDQYGLSVEGAKFAVYPASVEGEDLDLSDGLDARTWEYITDTSTKDSTLLESGYTVDPGTGIITLADGTTEIHPAFTGITGQDGLIVFRDEDDMPISMDAIVAEIGSSNFIMREIIVPDGYRTVAVNDEIKIVYRNGRFICSNMYETGVWASASMTSVAPNTLYFTDKKDDDGSYITQNYHNPSDGTTNGTLFAVILKRDGETLRELSDVGFWHPVSGDDLSGYKVWDLSDITASVWNADAAKEAAIAAAKTYQKDGVYTHVFTSSASGMNVLLEDLPGDPETYWSYLYNQEMYANPEDLLDKEGKPSSVEYYVAYYWTSASSLDFATPDNTERVWSRAGVITDNSYIPFTETYSSTIEVPNIENRLLFMKTKEDESGDYIDGAVFAMYSVGEDTSGDLYYLADDGSHVYLTPNLLDPNTGTAKTSEGKTGTYSIYAYGPGNGEWYEDVNGYLNANDNGRIDVSLSDGTTLTISPARNADKEPESLVGATHDECSYINRKGTGHFGMLLPGSYVLREIFAPAGYNLNPTETKIWIDETGVYANAGTSEDGVNVANGPGYLVSTMHMFATSDSINETLRWIDGKLSVNASGTFAGFQNTNSWKYVYKAAESSHRPGFGDGTDSSAGNLMHLYMQYDAQNHAGDTSGGDDSKIFSYSYVSDHDPQGEQSYALFNKAGWSNLEIYQDTDWGQQKTNSKSLYTDLTDITTSPTGNLQHLFSGSTFVLVTDPVKVDLTVEKYGMDVSTRVKSNLEGTDFALYYLDENKNTYYLKNDCCSFLQVKEDKVPDECIFTTNADGQVTFRNLPEGTYFLQEIGTTVQGGITYYPITDTKVTVSREQSLGVVSMSGEYEVKKLTSGDTAYSAESGASQFLVEVVNYSQLSIELLKVDADSYDSNPEKPDLTGLAGAAFTIQKIKDKNGTEVNLYYVQDPETSTYTWREKRTNEEEDDLVMTSGEDGLLAIYGLEDGTYLVTEKSAPSGYALLSDPVEFTVTSQTLTYAGTDQMVVLKDGQNRLILKNRLKFMNQVLPDTGGWGFLLYILTAAACLMGGWHLYKKKKLKKISV